MLRTKPRPTPDWQNEIVEFWDDERSLGNGIIITLKPGIFYYDDCGVMGFDTVREANAEVARIAKVVGVRL